MSPFRRPRARIDAGELAGVANQLRVERLGARLADQGPMAVRDTIVRRGGDRVELHLDDGAVLRQRLFWPRTEVVAALCSIAWNDDVGWISVVRTTSGERRVDYAWLVELTPAGG